MLEPRSGGETDDCTIALRQALEKIQSLLCNGAVSVANIEGIECVPNLIDKILLETSEGPQKKYSRTAEMTEMLISVVLNFTRCFLKNLPPSEKIGKDHRKESEDRVLDWVSDTLFDILDPTIGRIPALDALLATTGSHNGMSHDTCLQDIILTSVVENYCLGRDGDDDLLKAFRQQLDESDSLKNDSINAKYFCERMLQSRSRVSVDTVEGDPGNEELEGMCSDNLFLGQIQSFLNSHDNDEPLHPLSKTM